MPVLTLYPTTVVSADAFTTAQLANVLGNTTTDAVHTGSLAIYAPVGGRFYFNMTDIPANAVVNSIGAKVIGRSNSAAARKAYSVDMYLGGKNTILKTLDTFITTANATYTYPTITNANLAAAGYTTASLRNNSIEWTHAFTSTTTTSYTTYWSKFWLEIDYTEAAGNALFLGENF